MHIFNSNGQRSGGTAA